MKRNQETWNLPAPPGFQDLRDDLPLEVYRQALPHWRQDGATYFVTFRLHDSLPRAKLDELRALKLECEEAISRGLKPTLPNMRSVDFSPHDRSHHTQCVLKPTLQDRQRWRDELAMEMMLRVERWLDQGSGSCCLKAEVVARMLTDIMHADDKNRYELACYVIMPNHVHAVVRPLNPEPDPLEDILRSWKGASARRINQLHGRSGTLWQRESFDRIIRDEEHLWRVIQYVGANPSRAGLPCGVVPLWIRPEWATLGWSW